MLNQAFRRAVDEYGPVDSWCDADNYRSGGDRAECTEMIPKILSQYISMQNSRVQVTYKNRVKGGTFSMGSNFKNNTTFVLNDGTILYFTYPQVIIIAVTGVKNQKMWLVHVDFIITVVKFL